MLSFGLILLAVAVLSGLVLAAVRAERAEYLLVLYIEGTFFLFERDAGGRYDRLSPWRLPMAALRYATGSFAVRRPVLRTPRPRPAHALARS
jgi:hypothetical protein